MTFSQVEMYMDNMKKIEDIKQGKSPSSKRSGPSRDEVKSAMKSKGFKTHG